MEPRSHRLSTVIEAAPIDISDCFSLELEAERHARGLSLKGEFKVNSIGFLRNRKDSKEIRGRRTALWLQHPQQAPGGNVGAFFEALESRLWRWVVGKTAL